MLPLERERKERDRKSAKGFWGVGILLPLPLSPFATAPTGIIMTVTTMGPFSPWRHNESCGPSLMMMVGGDVVVVVVVAVGCCSAAQWSNWEDSRQWPIGYPTLPPRFVSKNHRNPWNLLQQQDTIPNLWLLLEQERFHQG